MRELKNPFLQVTYDKVALDPTLLLDLGFKSMDELKEVLLTVDSLCAQISKMPLPVVQAISLVAGAMLKQHRVQGMTIKDLVKLHEDVRWASESAWAAVMPETGYLMPETKTVN